MTELVTTPLDDLCFLGDSLSDHRNEEHPWSAEERAAFDRLYALLKQADSWPMPTGRTSVATDLWEQIVAYVRNDEGPDDLYLTVLIEKAAKL